MKREKNWTILAILVFTYCGCSSLSDEHPSGRSQQDHEFPPHGASQSLADEPLTSRTPSVDSPHADDDSGPAEGGRSLDLVERITLPAISNTELQRRNTEANEEAHRLGILRPPQFSVPRSLKIDPSTAGTWEVLPDDRLLWRVRVLSGGAYSIGIGFSVLNLPDQAKLFLYTPDYSIIRGPFTHDDNSDHGDFWPLPVDGEEIVIEISLPPHVKDQLQLETLSATHRFYPVIFTPDSPACDGDYPDGCPVSQYCHPDVACAVHNPFGDLHLPIDLRDQIRAVGQMDIFNGVCNCSGTLINNTANDGRQLFITASHCFRKCEDDPERDPDDIFPNPPDGIPIDVQLDNLRIYWNYENAICRDYRHDPPGDSAGAGDGRIDQVTMTRAIILAEHEWALDPLDVALIELLSPIDPDYDVFFAGWRRDDDWDNVPYIALHHPSAQSKRIGIEYDNLRSDTVYTTSRVRAFDFEVGAIEGGSSGSALFNNEGLIAALAAGGSSIHACGMSNCNYGRFDLQWTRLAPYLDPLVTGATSLPGIGDPPDYDRDGDSIERWVDNCLTEPNISQSNCDDDYRGDACDDDVCVDFCGPGVSPRKGIVPVFYDGIWAHTGYAPEDITVSYCAYGAANGDRHQFHDVQLRWCDCNGYAEPRPDETGVCTADVCLRRNWRLYYDPHFMHANWQVISYATGAPDTTDLPAYPRSCWPSEPVEVDKYVYYPSASCSYDDYWSQWWWDLGDGAGTPGTGWCTYHCAPKSVHYKIGNDLDPVLEKRSSWLWKREMWWKSTFDPWPRPPRKENSDYFSTDPLDRYWGYLWLRPEWESGVRDITEVNKYHRFWVPAETGRMMKIPRRQDELFFLHATLTMPPSRLVSPDSHVAQTLIHIDEPQMALHAIPPELSGDAGKYAYSAGLAGPDTAIAGLKIMFIDGQSLEVKDFGYSTGMMAQEQSIQSAVMGSSSPVPNTIKFAASRFVRQIQNPQTDIVTRDEGIAIFGGQLSSGQLDNHLWIGRLGGLDQEGTPFYVWSSVGYSQNWPEPRSGAMMAFDEVGERLFLFGGTLSGGAVASDFWELDLGSMQWRMLSNGFPGLTDAKLVQYANQTYISSGKDNDGQVNPNIYLFDRDNLDLEKIADAREGPGVRENVSMSYGAFRSGRIIIYGGRDINGRDHTDLWEFDFETNSWSQRIRDCEGRSCPGDGRYAFIHANAQGRHIGLYASGDMAGNLYFKTGGTGDRWVGSYELHGPPPAMDCDSDGEIDPDSQKACKSGQEWYADVGRYSCGEPGSGEMICAVPQPTEMTLADSWNPSKGERIVDFVSGPEQYTYLLTNRRLHTFNLDALSDGLTPVDTDSVSRPGGGWHHPLTDRSYDIEIHGSHAYVASWSGLHVFSLEKPWDPEEVGHLSTDELIRDMAFLGKVLYLASGLAIIVVNAADPTNLFEVNRVDLDGHALKVGVNNEDRRLIALTQQVLQRFDVSTDPYWPYETDSMTIAGRAFDEMKVDGSWIYLAGRWTQSFFDDDSGGLVLKGSHELSEWVKGRALKEKFAERIMKQQNRYEVWGPAIPFNLDSGVIEGLGDLAYY